MNAISDLLAEYDAQLRSEAETPSAIDVRILGPLRLVTFSQGRGFITYRDLGKTPAEGIRDLVGGALSHYRANALITSVKWKARSHDHAPGLHEALVEHGFLAGESEAIMIGEARALAEDVALPAGILLHTIRSEADVNRMAHMQADVFEDFDAASMARALIERLARNDGMELWVAEGAGSIISCGRLEPVKGTAFAGIWGGATRPEWRGKGIYRAVTCARAKSALAAGKRWIHSDSTEFSRPILERAGLLKVSSTTPYVWKR